MQVPCGKGARISSIPRWRTLSLVNCSSIVLVISVCSCSRHYNSTTQFSRSDYPTIVHALSFPKSYLTSTTSFQYCKVYADNYSLFSKKSMAIVAFL